MKSLLLIGLFIIAAHWDVSCQTFLFHGNWTRLGTSYLFEFDLHLEHSGGNRVEGYFVWKFVQYDENDGLSVSYYKDKLGMTAKEFVKGTWNPAERTYYLNGYRKEDPNTIISLDEYLLKMDDNGDIGGDTKSQETWLGRINGKAVVLLDL